MEVPGKHEDPDQKKGSQGNSEKFCQPCGLDGDHVPAEGFCQTCDEFLCAECFKIHTKPRPSRNHVLLDKVNMPTSVPRPKKQKTTCTIICPDHHDEVIKFFCPEHNAVLCGVCAVVKHIQCKNVYIPDVAKEYKDSKEFSNLLETLNNLKTDIETLSNEIKEGISSVRETSAKAVEEIRQFRKELNEYLDKKEEELILAIRRMEEDDTKQLQHLTDELDSLKNENLNLMKQFKSVDNEISNLFVTSKQQMKQVQAVLDRFISCAEKNDETSYVFERGQTLKDLLVLNTDLGEIRKKSQPKTVNYRKKNITSKSTTTTDFSSKTIERKPDINVKTSNDLQKPYITGIVLLSPHTLLLADRNNKSVKKVDTISNTILFTLPLSSNPWDLTLLPQDQAAVTLPSDKKIQVISTKDKLSAVRTINVDENCYGISATKDNLIVSFKNPSKVNIMNIEGTVLISVKTDSIGQALFSYSEYNTVVVENKVPVIHVSDYIKNSVTKLSLGGEVLSTYTHNTWSGLDGMAATGDGQLMICNHKTHTVDVIAEGGKVIQTLLNSTHGIQRPGSICYCAEQNMLYVSSNSGGSVQAYNFNK